MKKLVSVFLVTVCAVVIFAGNVSAAPKKTSTNSKKATTVKDIFDAELYAKLNPDVVAVVGKSREALLNHYLTYGINENRKGSNLIDIASYKALNPDLAAIFGDDWNKYVAHYTQYGKKEGRSNGIVASTQTIQALETVANQVASMHSSNASVSDIISGVSAALSIDEKQAQAVYEAIAQNPAQVVKYAEAAATQSIATMSNSVSDPVSYIDFILNASNLEFAGLTNSGNVVIPATFTVDGQNYQVVGIEADAFHGSSELNSITIPDTVTHISGGALGNCDNLTSVTWKENTYNCDDINNSTSMCDGDVANFNDALVNEGIADETDNVWCVTNPE